MAEVYKVLGQATYDGGMGSVYVVPSGKQAVVSTVTACNLSGTDCLFSVYVNPGGGATNDENYVVWDCPLRAATTQTMTLGITLGSTDVLGAGSSEYVAFSAFGTEITP